MNDDVLRLAHERALAFLHGLPERHVGPRISREELLQALGGSLTERGEEGETVVGALAAAAERGTIASAGPRYYGFVIGGSLPVALAADWLTSSWDQNPGIYATSPLSSVVEEIAGGWILDLLDLPRSASFGFVTGCQMANFTALAAARHAVLRSVGWNVEESGLHGAPPVSLIAGEEAHVTIHTSLRMLGFGTSALRMVETDGAGRMRPEALERMIDGSSGPMIICAQAGNVNTGSFDPLREIAQIARRHGAWMHVDGAFGLWARASGARRHLADGIDLADSWATDAHKWLNVPYDNGIVIVRDSASHRASMTVTAAYLEQTTGVERDAVDWVPEFSRRARGITVYAALRHLGRQGVEDLVERCCARAQQMASLLSRNPRVRILNDVQLNQVLVRFGDDDELTRAVIGRVQRDGTCWLAGTTWHGMAAMRISFSNWMTSESDVERSADAILRSIG
ncbi:MAG TPA: aminotransferase class V-fold PLP-dependent enzyme [Thermoanaerobaculia bacterium]|nr:aminotransferase class V-fold PLP-dependent enzyme [Thermoanaerobaculia bacterium]